MLDEDDNIDDDDDYASARDDSSRGGSGTAKLLPVYSASARSGALSATSPEAMVAAAKAAAAAGAGSSGSGVGNGIKRGWTDSSADGKSGAAAAAAPIASASASAAGVDRSTDRREPGGKPKLTPEQQFKLEAGLDPYEDGDYDDDDDPRPPPLVASDEAVDALSARMSAADRHALRSGLATSTGGSTLSGSSAAAAASIANRSGSGLGSSIVSLPGSTIAAGVAAITGPGAGAGSGIGLPSIHASARTPLLHDRSAASIDRSGGRASTTRGGGLNDSFDADSDAIKLAEAASLRDENLRLAAEVASLKRAAAPALAPATAAADANALRVAQLEQLLRASKIELPPAPSAAKPAAPCVLPTTAASTADARHAALSFNLLPDPEPTATPTPAPVSTAASTASTTASAATPASTAATSGTPASAAAPAAQSSTPVTAAGAAATTAPVNSSTPAGSVGAKSSSTSAAAATASGSTPTSTAPAAAPGSKPKSAPAAAEPLYAVIGGHQLTVGDFLDAMDTIARKWLPASIIKVYPGGRRIRVNYFGWDSKYDYDFDVGSPDIAPFQTRASATSDSLGPSAAESRSDAEFYRAKNAVVAGSASATAASGTTAGAGLGLGSTIGNSVPSTVVAGPAGPATGSALTPAGSGAGAAAVTGSGDPKDPKAAAAAAQSSADGELAKKLKDLQDDNTRLILAGANWRKIGETLFGAEWSAIHDLFTRLFETQRDIELRIGNNITSPTWIELVIERLFAIQSEATQLKDKLAAAHTAASASTPASAALGRDEKGGDAKDSKSGATAAKKPSTAGAAAASTTAGLSHRSTAAVEPPPAFIVTHFVDVILNATAAALPLVLSYTAAAGPSAGGAAASSRDYKAPTPGRDEKGAAPKPATAAAPANAASTSSAPSSLTVPRDEKFYMQTIADTFHVHKTIPADDSLLVSLTKAVLFRSHVTRTLPVDSLPAPFSSLTSAASSPLKPARPLALTRPKLTPTEFTGLPYSAIADVAREFRDTIVQRLRAEVADAALAVSGSSATAATAASAARGRYYGPQALQELSAGLFPISAYVSGPACALCGLYQNSVTHKSMTDYRNKHGAALTSAALMSSATFGPDVCFGGLSGVGSNARILITMAAQLLKVPIYVYFHAATAAPLNVQVSTSLKEAAIGLPPPAEIFTPTMAAAGSNDKSATALSPDSIGNAIHLLLTLSTKQFAFLIPKPNFSLPVSAAASTPASATTTAAPAGAATATAPTATPATPTAKPSTAPAASSIPSAATTATAPATPTKQQLGIGTVPVVLGAGKTPAASPNLPPAASTTHTDTKHSVGSTAAASGTPSAAASSVRSTIPAVVLPASAASPGGSGGSTAPVPISSRGVTSPSAGLTVSGSPTTRGSLSAIPGLARSESNSSQNGDANTNKPQFVGKRSESPRRNYSAAPSFSRSTSADERESGDSIDENAFANMDRAMPPSTNPPILRERSRYDRRAGSDDADPDRGNAHSDNDDDDSAAGGGGGGSRDERDDDRFDDRESRDGRRSGAGGSGGRDWGKQRSLSPGRASSLASKHRSAVPYSAGSSGGAETSFYTPITRTAPAATTPTAPASAAAASASASIPSHPPSLYSSVSTTASLVSTSVPAATSNAAAALFAPSTTSAPPAVSAAGSKPSVSAVAIAAAIGVDLKPAAAASTSAATATAAAAAAAAAASKTMKLDDISASRQRGAIHIVYLSAVYSFVVDVTNRMGAVFDEFCHQLTTSPPAATATTPGAVPAPIVATPNHFQFEEQNSQTQIQGYNTVANVLEYAGVSPVSGSAYIVAKKIR